MSFRKKEGFTEKKFWAKVVKTDGCWMWTGCKSDFGHGQVRIDNINSRAHRVSWEWHNGPIPKGQCVLHKCDVPACVNPDHLFLGTKKDNTQDMMRKGRNKYISHRGEKSGVARLSRAQVEQIKKEYKPGSNTQSEIGKKYGIGQSHVSQIIRGAIWGMNS